MRSQSQTVGPYTLEKRLGAGGMGEVYRAYDRRLDRWVAIKLIRPEYTENATARERFRREARAAARLSHPSIVQIYDIVESEESDAIVLELVEGEPLSRKIARGPLPLEEAVRLGRQIAEGLAAAHARGIIHRDLKAENVMVTPEGHAKILDFGLAKRLEGDASLTEDNRVIGTFRSMSPEQARGLPLDQRSDLFSFGILLYEMLSGRSPFEGGSTLETLTRICSHRQASLRELEPSVPAELSHLVDSLLEKDPLRRPQSARQALTDLEGLTGTRAGSPRESQATWIEGRPPAGGHPSSGISDLPPPRKKHQVLLVAVTALVAVVALLVWGGSRLARPPERVYVAVPKPLIGEGRDSADAALLASGLRMAVLGTLTTLEGVSPLAPELVDLVEGSPFEIARATAARELVTSRLDCSVEVCQVSLARVQGADGRLLWTGSFTIPPGQPHLLAEVVQARLPEGYSGHSHKKEAPPMGRVHEVDYKEFLRIWNDFGAYQASSQTGGPSLERLLTRIDGVRRGSPAFLEADLLKTRILEHRFHSSRSLEDLESASEILRHAQARFPHEPRILTRLVQISITAGRLDQAGAALGALEKIEPGDPNILIQRARILQRQDQPEQARRLAREAVRRLPSWANLFWAASLELATGDVAAARGYLEDLLDRYPGHFAGRSLLGNLELMSGSPERAVALYSELVRQSPQFDEISNLGLAFFLLENYGQAELWFRRAWTLQPNNSSAALNLADTLLLLDRKAEAEGFYRKVVELIAGDPAAKGNWQLQTIRGQALAHLGEKRDAVESAQRALGLAPENPQARYEASLIYALVGDGTSALANAARARELGYEARWFSFPWFDLLRSSPEFQRIQGPSTGLQN